MKVILNKSTKIKGKGLVLAGIEVSVTDAQEKQLKKDGFLGNVKKSNMPSNEKEIKELVAKVTKLEAQIADGGGDDELAKEIETLKVEVESKDTEIETLKVEVESLKNNAADLTAPNKK